ncbi:MAG: HD domain-containing protein [Deltaproteobacteria bacterium]|nr:HD domain-containing protein [Deltaproteobacteria bacterium]
MKDKSATIRCPIHGSIHLNSRELRLIDSPYFQRLRYISQLGFASFVFPGAVHTRFGHSLGSVHLAGKVYEQLMEASGDLLKNFYNKEQLEYFRQILRFSALLHDIGHPPFSHAGESILPDIGTLPYLKHSSKQQERQATHEDFSLAIIHHLSGNEKILTREESQDIISILALRDEPSARMNSREGSPIIYPLLCQLINGEIDVDRMDYLLRDAYYAGVPYGKFDLERLIGSFSCYLEKDLNQFLLAIDGEAVPTYENFLMARIHMFYQIYFHKSLGAYSYYLKKVFDEEEIALNLNGSLENYLNISEAALMEEFRKARDKKWSGKIHYRIPAKNLIRVNNSDKERLKILFDVEELLKTNQIETYVSYSSNHFSTQIKNVRIHRKTIVVIDEEFGFKTATPLAEKSSLLEDREKLIEITQLYINREQYQDVISLIQKHRPQLSPTADRVISL